MLRIAAVASSIALFCLGSLAGCGWGGTPPGRSGPLVITPSQLSFQATSAGVPTAAQTITVRNSADTPASLQGITLGGANAAQFTLTNQCGPTLAPSASCTLGVSFTAEDPGTFSGSVAVGVLGYGPSYVTLKGVLAQPPNPVINGRFVYAGTTGPNTIAMYTLTPTGALKPNTPASIAVEQEPDALAVDPLGDFLFAADVRNGNMSVFRIDQNTGLLSQMPDLVAADPTGFPERVIVDPQGRFVYMANRGTGTISTFTIDRAAGRIVAGPVVPSGTSKSSDPNGMAVDHAGKFLYVANEGEDHIAMFSIDQVTGVPTPLTPAFIGGADAFTLHFDPAGKFLYDPQSSGDRIDVLQQDPVTGQLTRTTAGGTGAGEGPTDFTLTPDGKFAYVTDRDADTLSLFSVDSTTGTLTALPSSPKPLAGEPYIIKLDSSGQLAYICTEGGGVVTERINADGSLSYINTASLPGITEALAVYPVSQY